MLLRAKQTNSKRVMTKSSRGFCSFGLVWVSDALFLLQLWDHRFAIPAISVANCQCHNLEVEGVEAADLSRLSLCFGHSMQKFSTSR